MAALRDQFVQKCDRLFGGVAAGDAWSAQDVGGVPAHPRAVAFLIPSDVFVLRAPAASAQPDGLLVPDQGVADAKPRGRRSLIEDRSGAPVAEDVGVAVGGEDAVELFEDGRPACAIGERT